MATQQNSAQSWLIAGHSRVVWTGVGIIIQTIYDLRSQGQGPRGFRVGRELRFRVSEIDSWLAQMEADDADRHPQAYR